MPEAVTRTRANALITVRKYEPAAYDEPAQGPALTRIHVEEALRPYCRAVVEFLQAARADGAASFVGIERVSGSVGGRAGTFLLQDAGTVNGNIVSGDWSVIQGSGTGELSGLRGEGGFRAASARVPRCTWTTGSNEPPARVTGERIVSSSVASLDGKCALVTGQPLASARSPRHWQRSARGW